VASSALRRKALPSGELKEDDEFTRRDVEIQQQQRRVSYEQLRQLVNTLLFSSCDDILLVAARSSA